MGVRCRLGIEGLYETDRSFVAGHALSGYAMPEYDLIRMGWVRSIRRRPNEVLQKALRRRINLRWKFNSKSRSG